MRWLVVLCCRLKARKRALCLYNKYAEVHDGPDDGSDMEVDDIAVNKVVKQMRIEGFALPAKPRRFVEDTVKLMHDTGSLHDRPRSGRRTNISKVGAERMDEVCDALEEGYINDDGVQMPYTAGAGIAACLPARELMREKHLHHTKLWKMCRQHRPKLTVRTMRKRFKLSDKQKAARKEIATLRRQMPRGWQKRVFMLDACSKYVSKLVGAKLLAIVNKDKDLTRKIYSDVGLGVGGKTNGAKLHWMTMINMVGGPGPLAWLTGTHSRKGKVYKVGAACMCLHHWHGSPCMACAMSLAVRSAINHCDTLLASRRTLCMPCSSSSSSSNVASASCTCCLPSTCTATAADSFCLWRSRTSTDRFLPTCHSQKYSQSVPNTLCTMGYALCSSCVGAARRSAHTTLPRGTHMRHARALMPNGAWPMGVN